MRPVDRDAFLRPSVGTAAGVGRLDTGRRAWTPRPGWYAYRVDGAAELPSWAVEIALTVERPEGGPAAQALVLLRAPGRLPWLDGIAEAIAEVETVAGIRPADPEDGLVDGTGWSRGLQLLAGPALPGLTPVTAGVVWEHLRIAGSRGLPAPLRRRRPAAGAGDLAWHPGAGCVLTCDGPDGRSAQAVVGLRGTGNPAAIALPPGAALVLRVWRSGAGCGLAFGLVLGAPATLGLGREARRVAAAARSGGWDASVLSGSAAVLLARAGCPRRPAPREAALAATRTEVTALFEACLTATDLAGDRQRRPSDGP